MRKFIKRIILYIALAYAILFIMQVVVDNGLQQVNNNTFGDWNRIINSKLNSDIIIQGNSRAFVQINPSIIEDSTQLSCYNIGLDGSTIDIQLARWNIYSKYNKKPKIIIQNVDLLTLVTDKKIYNIQQYLPYLNTPQISKLVYTKLPSYKIINNLPFMKYYGSFDLVQEAITQYIKPINSYNRNKGFEGRNKLWDGKYKELKKITNSDGKIYYDPETIAKGKLILEQFIEDCQKEQIKVVLVHTPYHYHIKPYLSQQEETIQYFKDLASSKNIVFWDYSEDSIGNNTHLFYNTTHLNNDGATILTQKISQDLNSLIESFKNTSLPNSNLAKMKDEY